MRRAGSITCPQLLQRGNIAYGFAEKAVPEAAKKTGPVTAVVTVAMSD